jgi:Uma2 family endonuclease
MPEATPLVTAEELERLPNHDHRVELVEGRVVRMTPVSFAHSRTVARLCALLDSHVRNRDLGVVGTELGVTLKVNPDIVRAPDVAFIRRERIPVPEPRGFWKGAPDLAVEVISPDDRPCEVAAKVAEYLHYAVLLVVVIDPDVKSVVVHRPSAQPIVLGTDDVLDLSDVMSGFQCRVREIFEGAGTGPGVSSPSTV